MAKIGGRWTGLPDEVVELLAKENLSCAWTYVLMLKRFYVEQVTDTEGLWIAGRIQASRNEVIRSVSKSRGNFRINIWPRWLEIGIVEIKDGGIYLPMVFKKGEEYFEPSVMREELAALRSRQAEMEYDNLEMRQTIQSLVKFIDKGQEVISARRASLRPGPGLCEARTGPHRGPGSLLLDTDTTLTQRDANKLVSGFYREIGRKRVSKTVRDKAIASIKKLMDDSYLPGEIAYALDWIPKNATEDIKHFGIVPHMIDQALEAGRKELEIEEARQVIEEQRREDKQHRLSDEEETAAVQNYKEQLPDDEREELRNDAILKLRGMEGIKHDFISPPLIDAIENELIREKGVDLSAFRPPAETEGDEDI